MKLLIQTLEQPPRLKADYLVMRPNTLPSCVYSLSYLHCRPLIVALTLSPSHYRTVTLTTSPSMRHSAPRCPVAPPFETEAAVGQVEAGRDGAPEQRTCWCQPAQSRALQAVLEDRSCRLWVAHVELPEALARRASRSSAPRCITLWSATACRLLSSAAPHALTCQSLPSLAVNSCTADRG